MKRLTVLTLLMLLLTPKPVEAEIRNITATAYNISGTTATGTQTAENRTVAGKPEWLGMTMYVWADDGDGKIKPKNFLGIYTVEDTGGQTIKDGKVIDIYIADYDEAVEFGSKSVIIQLVDSEG